MDITACNPSDMGWTGGFGVAMRPYPPSLFAVLNPTHPSRPSQAFRCAHCLWHLMRVLAGPGWHLRMSTELWVASTDVCEICGGLRTDRTSPQAAEWRPWRISTDFLDSDGVRRILAGFCGTPRFSGGCARMPAQLLWEGYSFLSGQVASPSAKCAASQLHVLSTAWLCHCLCHLLHKNPHLRSANCCLSWPPM